MVLGVIAMKFDKEEKSGGKRPGDKKKIIIGVVIGLVVLAFILLPMLLGGLR